MEAARATEVSGPPSSHETTILDSMCIHSPPDLQPLPSLPPDGFSLELEAPEQTSAYSLLDWYTDREDLQWWGGGHE